MALLFWASLAVIFYVYVGYPLLLVVWSALRPEPAPAPEPTTWPGISVIVIARNEAARLAARIDNLRACDYPDDRRQVIVVSDGSTDHTTKVLAAYAGKVDTLVLPPVGKAAALNEAVRLARHKLLVFADARQAFDPSALKALVRRFADPEVGAVTGELLLDSETGERRRRERRQRGRPVRRDRRVVERSGVADGMGIYWRYEKSLRRMESRINSTLGATGAIYAMRTSLWRPLPPDTLLDDVLAPMRVVLAGHRVVFEESAKAYDRASASADLESRRKVRTLTGNVQIFWLEPRLLLPVVNPVWLQYTSHKLGRLIVPYALLTLFAATLPLTQQHPAYVVALIGQSALYLLAAYGAYLESQQSGSQTQPAPSATAPAWPTASTSLDERRA